MFCGEAKTGPCDILVGIFVIVLGGILVAVPLVMSFVVFLSLSCCCCFCCWICGMLNFHCCPFVAVSVDNIFTSASVVLRSVCSSSSTAVAVVVTVIALIMDIRCRGIHHMKLQTHKIQIPATSVAVVLNFTVLSLLQPLLLQLVQLALVLPSPATGDNDENGHRRRFRRRRRCPVGNDEVLGSLFIIVIVTVVALGLCLHTVQVQIICVAAGVAASVTAQHCC